MPVHPRDELLELAHHRIPEFIRAFLRLVKALVFKNAIEGAVDGVAKVVAESMTLADLMGRRRVFLELDAAVRADPSIAIQPATLETIGPLPARQVRPSPISTKPGTLETIIPGGPRPPAVPTSTTLPRGQVPRVPFTEAVKDIVKREPRLAANAEEVAALYRDTHSFAVARSAEQALTARVQAVTADLIEAGASPRDAAKLLQGVVEGTEDWTKSYAETVYRTNLNTAYSAGRFEQANDPDIAAVMPALERFSMGDVDVRRGRKEDSGENHQAANGLVAATNDPIWATHSPPSGYRCRCQVRLLSITELRRRNLLDESGRVLRREPKNFSEFRPHPNFARKPSDVIYGGGAIV